MADQFKGRLTIPPSDNIRTVPTHHNVMLIIPAQGPHETLYLNRQGVVELLRANKYNHEAIQFIADMLE